MFLRPISLSLALLLTTAPVFAQTAPTPPAVTPTEPRETIERACGFSPDEGPLLDYLEAKFSDLYGL